MKLFGSYTSPYVRHCRVALAQSGFDFEFIEADYVKSAQDSPTAKVPYLIDGELMLSDSSSILKYIREKSGRAFLAEVEDYDSYAMASTLLDATVNLFLIENDGYGPNQINYLARQKNRIESGLKELNQRFGPDNQDIARDSVLRCACFVDWALFRKRISIDGLTNIQGLLDAANQVEAFSETAPSLSV